MERWSSASQSLYIPRLVVNVSVSVRVCCAELRLVRLVTRQARQSVDVNDDPRRSTRCTAMRGIRPEDFTVGLSDRPRGGPCDMKPNSDRRRAQPWHEIDTARPLQPTRRVNFTPPTIALVHYSLLQTPVTHRLHGLTKSGV